MKKISLLLATLLSPSVLFAMEDWMVAQTKKEVTDAFSAMGLALLLLGGLGLTLVISLGIGSIISNAFQKTFLKVKGATEKEWNTADGIMLVLVGIITSGFGLFGGGKSSGKRGPKEG
jgi:hypothetical protein